MLFLSRAGVCCLAGLLFLCLGCPERRGKTSARTDFQEELAEKVGGAPKRQIDEVKRRLKISSEKAAARMNQLEGVE